MPSEVRTQELYPMPFIEMNLVTQPVRVHNVQGDVREQEAYIDFNFYYTDTDNVDSTTFGKIVCDEIVNKIMTYRHDVSSCSWMEVVNDGREIIETDGSGKQVVFHRVVEVYCMNFNSV